VDLISLLPLIPLTTTSWSLASHLGSAVMSLFLAGSSLTYHLAAFALNVITTSLPFILHLVVFPKPLPSTLRHVLYPSQYSYLFPFSRPPSLCRWYSALLLFPPSQLLTQVFFTFKTLFNRSFPGWLLIFWLLTHLRLNSCSSDSKTNLPKYTTFHLTNPTLLETSASSLTNMLLSLTLPMRWRVPLPFPFARRM